MDSEEAGVSDAAETQKKVLLVEDDLALNELYTMYIKEAGYEVVSAHDGKEGFEAFEKGNFDVVLLDLMLPKMNGFEFLKRRKELHGKEGVPIVALTALGGEGKNEDKALNLGAKEYLVKSDIEPEDILKVVQKYT